MAIELLLSLDKQACVLGHCDGELLGEAVPLSGLPRIGGVKDEEGHERENPFYRNPYALGQRLFAALGGEALLALVVMSACQTAASARDADLARALVRAGIPAAIGMQGNFPDALSDEFAAYAKLTRKSQRLLVATFSFGGGVIAFAILIVVMLLWRVNELTNEGA